MADLTIRTREGVELSAEEAGDGTPVVGLHGLTATRRYVLMGSRNLERSGHRVVLYDARGHGRSGPGPRYDYDALAGDLEAVLDDRGIERAVLVGASMGAHTLLRFALDHPDRVAAMAVVTPAFDPDHPDGSVDRYRALARGLREGGVDGFLSAYGEPAVPEQWRDTVRTVLRQRLSAHEHPEAVADALEQVPPSRPFERWADLERIQAPAVVIASRDEADPDHPFDLGRRYAETLPGARLLTEEPGKSPLAWQGGQLSRAIAELAGRGFPA